jgi:aryl-alcohol dehydrogenase-like predicted oxidoreductase
LGRLNVEYIDVYRLTRLDDDVPIEQCDDFSTSSKRGVSLDQTLELLPVDRWRRWLTANAPETSDVDFSFSQSRPMPITTLPTRAATSRNAY